MLNQINAFKPKIFKMVITIFSLKTNVFFHLFLCFSQRPPSPPVYQYRSVPFYRRRIFRNQRRLQALRYIQSTL